MTALARANLPNTGRDIVFGAWPELHSHITKIWARIPAETLTLIEGHYDALVDAVMDAYNLQRDQADAMVSALTEGYDRFDEMQHHGDISEKIAHYWTKLTPADLNSLSGRRTNLVSALERRYDINRSSAWKQVILFFRHFR